MLLLPDDIQGCDLPNVLAVSEQYGSKKLDMIWVNFISGPTKSRFGMRGGKSK